MMPRITDLDPFLLCNLSALILPGSKKCLTNFKGFSDTCRRCDLEAAIERRFNTPVEEKTIVKFPDMISDGSKKCGGRRKSKNRFNKE